MLPLEGITVVAVEQAVAAPFATRQLADLGARVIKVESPRGGDVTRQWSPPVHDGESAYYLSVNRRKESVAVDLDDNAAQRARVHDLVHGERRTRRLVRRLGSGLRAA